MKCKLNLLLITALLLISLLTSGCKQTQVITPKFHGDYATENLRQMWAFCFQAFQTKSPYAHPDQIGTICDCYVDEMRKTHPQKDINTLGDIETKKMGQQLIKVCNPKTESINI